MSRKKVTILGNFNYQMVYPLPGWTDFLTEQWTREVIFVGNSVLLTTGALRMINELHPCIPPPKESKYKYIPQKNLDR